jgi:hypothetical protein
VSKRTAPSRPASGRGRKGGATEGRSAASRRAGKARQRKRLRRTKEDSALLTGTSGEYLGRRPLPRVLRQRPLVVVCGPRCVGKSSVAAVIAGDKARVVDDRGLHQATLWRVRKLGWSKTILEEPCLVIDGPVFLASRPAAAGMVAELIKQRVLAGLRTILVEGPVDDGSVLLLMDAVPPEQRITLTLRFPVEGGRLRFALRVCDELGLARSLARETLALEHWCYQGVRRYLAECRHREPER